MEVGGLKEDDGCAADASVRRGPRPLALYLAAASRIDGHSEPSCTALAGFVDGVKAYWRHPFRQPAMSGQTIWQAGSACLRATGPEGGMPVLLVPSLVNRAYVLDLLPGRSLVAELAKAGHRVLLLDWGEPGPVELGFGIADHLARHLEPCLQAATRESGRLPIVLGYCMGGLLALALAASAPSRLAGLALLATPWDFAAARAQQPLPAPVAASMLAGIVATYGHVPANMLDWTFGALDPAQVVAKYAAFGRADPTSERSRAFVAIEDWLGDGVALAGPVAGECLLDWYVANRPAAGIWRVAGRYVRPETLDLPAFVAVPRRDRIVPEASAMPLARLLPRATLVQPATGHVGMVAGGRAAELLWQPLLAWISRIAHATV
jgi:poly(3-hydroxyalkanoate) synthetase